MAMPEAPAFARLSTVAFPIPVAPPVTSTTLPSSSIAHPKFVIRYLWSLIFTFLLFTFSFPQLCRCPLVNNPIARHPHQTVRISGKAHHNTILFRCGRRRHVTCDDILPYALAIPLKRVAVTSPSRHIQVEDVDW